jgi:hypothetical protein
VGHVFQTTAVARMFWSSRLEKGFGVNISENPHVLENVLLDRGLLTAAAHSCLLLSGSYAS